MSRAPSTPNAKTDPIGYLKKAGIKVVAAAIIMALLPTGAFAALVFWVAGLFGNNEGTAFYLGLTLASLFMWFVATLACVIIFAVGTGFLGLGKAVNRASKSNYTPRPTTLTNLHPPMGTQTAAETETLPDIDR